MAKGKKKVQSDVVLVESALRSIRDTQSQVIDEWALHELDEVRKILQELVDDWLS